MASFLINQPGIDVNLPDYDNKKISKDTITTIFEEAIRHNMNDIAEDFKNINLQEDINYSTPLHIAIKKHYLELIQKLLNHPNIDLDITNKERYTPLRHFVTEIGQMMWNNNNKEKVISILECFAKHQDRGETAKF
ncbi:Ankyrin repeat and FYVE domain-containing protein 1 [Tritrichomonas musculus]|uniref:Ankyrin repeat and FYVE domain-containing protein 1 n=1 Tax=Tritrichomonas musculus TaxID=1915356 RepID=A0ABR2L7K4_9EUKA